MTNINEQGRRESRDERSHRVASEIIHREQMDRDKKTARLRAMRLKNQKRAAE